MLTTLCTTTKQSPDISTYSDEPRSLFTWRQKNVWKEMIISSEAGYCRSSRDISVKLSVLSSSADRLTKAANPFVADTAVCTCVQRGKSLTLAEV